MAALKTVKAYATQGATEALGPHSIKRRVPLDKDVEIDILFCGICHSDLHQAHNDWGFSKYPMVPGHEIVGRVNQVGSAVSKFKPGDLVGVGCIVDSDRTCEHCKAGFENDCKTMTGTYNGADKHLGGVTFGGYSESVVVDEAYVLRIPANLDPARTAPLLCAGITVYSPMRRHGVTAGKKIGVVGLGGLGHMAIKIGVALGAEVTLFTTSPGKEADAKRLGASHVIVSKDAEAMKQAAGSLDYILDTVSADHDIPALLKTLKVDGTLCLVGLPSKPLSIPPFAIVSGRKNVTGSNIGGIRETQEMLDFCGQKNILSDIELIPIQKVNEAYARMDKGDVKYRFVIDNKTLKTETKL